MVTIEKKKEIVAELKEKFIKASGFYLVDFMGMTVASAIKFRRDLKKENIGYKVAKNTLIKRALDEAGNFNIPEKVFRGGTAIVFGFKDPVSPAKIIKEQFDKFELPRLKAAIIEGQFYDGSQLKQIAALQSKPEIIAGILSSLDAPISGIVGSIGAVMRDLAYLVEEVAKKQAAN